MHLCICCLQLLISFVFTYDAEKIGWAKLPTDMLNGVLHHFNLFYFSFLSQSKVRKTQSQKDEGHEKQEVEKKMKAETLKANEIEGNEVHWVSNYLSSSQGIVIYSSNVHIWCQFTVTPSENLNMIYTNRSGREIKTSKIQIFFLLHVYFKKQSETQSQDVKAEVRMVEDQNEGNENLQTPNKDLKTDNAEVKLFALIL